ncbi:MAG: 6-carboxytetrahydropterin synthase [Saprospiraceae bacterium]|nr:6-carboxytetrahydropterin synthase [Saprospiraceae bacterium]
MKVAIFRRAHFNAAHKLYKEEWSHEKNLEVFGICTSPNYHGHNYDLEVKVVGELDEDTGMVINLKTLKDIIKVEVEDRFDHKNLNLDVSDFQNMTTTAENICIVIWRRLVARLPEDFEVTVRLYETPRNYVEFPA